MRICRWPKTGNISKMISEYAEYGNDWPTYPVKIISQYYACSSTSLTPIKVKKCDRDQTAAVVSRPFNTSHSNNFQTDYEMFQSITSALNCVDNSILEEEPIPEISLETKMNKMQNEQNQQDMVEQIATILAYVKRIDKKLDTVMEGSASLNIINDENNLVSLFPITTVEALQNIETKLLDATFEKQMINFVAQIVGLNTHNFTKRVFARVFTNALATQYAWTGFRNNNPLKQLKLIKIIKDVCLKTFKIRRKKDMHSMYKRNFLRCIKNTTAEQSSPDVTQNISKPFVQAHVINDLNNHQQVYTETNNILQPSEQLVDGSDNNINDDGISNLINSDYFENAEKTSLVLKLNKWIIEYHVSHNCVNALLAILISEGHDLPRTARTLLKTPKLKDHKIISIHPGFYIHFGVEFMMSKILMMHLDSFDTDIIIELGMNIDGLPFTNNQSFREKKDEFYHKDIDLPLEDLPIDIPSVVVLEYMHNACLGVMKKLLSFWVKGKKPVRLVNPESISEELCNIKSFLPVEFNRLPRPLDEFEYWKASEFRTFLIYTGPIVLRGRLKTTFYNHFMILCCAIRILICPITCVAKMLLKQFVSDYPSHYGPEYVGYNVHGLIHIADFVLTHGCLDRFSAFKYENYLQFVKKSCKNASQFFKPIPETTRTLNDDDSTIDQPQTKMLKLNVTSTSNESSISSSSSNVLDISFNSDEQPIQPIINFLRHKICEKQRSFQSS
ncbi:hypothetical protein ACI65C_004848 [Semiaphis heraclei]